MGVSVATRKAMIHQAEHGMRVDVRLKGVVLNVKDYLCIDPLAPPILTGMEELEVALIRQLMADDILKVELWPDRLRWVRHPRGQDNRVNGIFKILRDADIALGRGAPLPTDLLTGVEGLAYGDLHQAFWGEVKNFAFQVSGTLVDSGRGVVLDAQVKGLVNPFGQHMALLLVRERGTKRRWQPITVPVGGSVLPEEIDNLYELEDF